jgi:hypothetical protein
MVSWVSNPTAARDELLHPNETPWAFKSACAGWGLIPVDGEKSTDSDPAVEDDLPKRWHRGLELLENSPGAFMACALRQLP